MQTTTFLYSFVSENYFFIVLRIELASLKEDSSTSLIAFLKCYYLLPFGKQDPIVIYIYYQVYDMMCDLFLYHTQQSVSPTSIQSILKSIHPLLYGSSLELVHQYNSSLVACSVFFP